MRWVVVGSHGMLGQDMVALLRERAQDVVPLDRADVDITRAAEAASALRGADVVVNCAAHTAVDLAESEEDAAFAVNAVGAANVARGARAAGAKVVHVSTDYVFGGDCSEAYREDAPPAPRSAYGRTKLAGEWAVRAENADHLVVRTAWLYGRHGRCFPRTIVSAMRRRGALDVVEDQVGQPTWTADLADLVHRLVVADVPSGTYHGTSAGRATWFDFARAAVASAGLDPAAVRPATTDAVPRAAVRPAFSVLAHDALRAVGVDPIGPWDARWAVASGTVLDQLD